MIVGSGIRFSSGVNIIPDMAMTSLLLHFNGSNGSTTFIDSSSFGLSVTGGGNAQLSTAQQKFGTASALFDGSGDSLQLPSSSALDFGTDPFTVEFWMRTNGTQDAFSAIVSRWSNAPSTGGTTTLGINNRNSNQGDNFIVNIGGTIRISWAPTVNDGLWHHVAVSRQGVNLYLGVDGTIVASNSSVGVSDSVTLSSGRIGRSQNNDLTDNNYNGYLDEFRVTKGAALYTTTYTVPTAEFIPNPYSVSYLVVAGGGSGGSADTNTGTGGGGAGGYLSGTTTLTVGTTYTVIVGGGGASPASKAVGNNGSNSSALSQTAIGGGGGGSSISFGAVTAPNTGGSGGGACGTYTTGTNAGAAGTSGQGFAGGGGVNSTVDANLQVGGGGGGASAVGVSGSAGGGNGGAGSASSITGTSVTRAGGGGGGKRTSGTAGTGGTGGGGNGAADASGSAGSVNTGGGGGGCGTGSNILRTGGAGGSGVVIISVPTANYSGTTTGSPTVTTSGDNTIITFNSSGSYTA